MRRVCTPAQRRSVHCAAATVAAVVVACSDPTGASGRGAGAGTSRLVVTVTRPAGDTLSQLGVEFTARLRDSVPMRALVLYVDSGATARPTYAYTFGVYGTVPLPSLAGVAFAPAETGRHTFTLVATDTAGRTASATFARTFAVPDEPYAVAALPDLGNGAGPVGLTAGGDVAGWVGASGGRVRPAVWRAGALQLPAVPDTADAVAVRTNAAGDVLLQIGGRFGVTTTSARVLRADGALLALGPRDYKFSWTTNAGTPASPCCSLAADLNEGRVAVGASYGPANNDQSVVFDVARGAVVDSADFRALVVNGAGRAAGIQQGNADYQYENYFALRTLGFATPPVSPPGYRYNGYCGAAHGIGLTQSKPVDLDDADALLLNDCGNGIYIPPGGAPVFVDRYVGPGTQVHLSRQGGIVAALDAAGAIHLWRAGTTRVTRVRTAQGAWYFDSLAAVNARGQIAVLATDRTTGRLGALLLTPGS